MQDEFVSAVKPAVAREALRVVAEEVEARTQASSAVLNVVINELEAFRGRYETAAEDCPCCGCPYLSLAYVNEHVSACSRHPFIVKVRALCEAVRLAPEICRSLGLEVVAVDGSVVNDLERVLAPCPAGRRGRYVPKGSYLRRHVSFLTGAERKEYPTLVAGAVKELDAAVELWERLLHRDTDLCRFCGKETPLKDVRWHALSCARHPAAIAAATAETWLRAQLGEKGVASLVELVLRRDQFINGLAVLVNACQSFESEWGWNGEEYYSRSDDEATLDRAIAAAAKLVGLGPVEYRRSFEPVSEAAAGPEFARPVWKALLRVRENGPAPGSHTGTEADSELLRTALSEADELRSATGEDFACPACKRAGLWVNQIALHVPACPCHPAAIRDRATEAQLSLAVSVLREKRRGQLPPEVRLKVLSPIQRFRPSARSDDDAGWAEATRACHQDASRALQFLLASEKRLRYPTLVDEHAEKVASTLSDWQRYRIAVESACPYCTHRSPFLELLGHMAECPAHPGRARADANEAMLSELGAAAFDLPARMQRDADAARIATARLAEFAESFKGSFGDDDRGRGIVYKSLILKWNSEVKLAGETLRGLRARATSP